jgi:hypothetical protein
MTETSRPPQIPPLQIPTEAIERFVAGIVRSLSKTRTRADFVLVPDPAVGGNVNLPLISDPGREPGDDPIDVNRREAAIVKAHSAADEYQALAYELGDLINRYKSLKSRTVVSPADGDPTAPALLGSSMVKLDMTEHLVRAERFQVAAMGYAGAWTILADSWSNLLADELAYEQKQAREAAADLEQPAAEVADEHE